MSISQNKGSAKQSNKADVKQEVTDSIISLIESGTIETLRDAWTGGSLGLPKNLKTGAHYSGVNVMILTMASMMKNYASNEWMTFKQALDVGGCVRKGEKATLGVFFKRLEIDSKEGAEEGETIAFAKSLHLFNVAQIDGLPASEVVKIKPNAAQILEDCEALINASGAKITYSGNRAFYRPSTDEIYLPERADFYTTAGFYSTAFHELAHWTGAKNRLDRDFSKRFGDEKYAMEELVAELAAAFVCAHTSIQNESIQQNAAYLANWLQVLKNDKNAIFTAASAAWKAASFILKLEEKTTEKELETEAA